MLSDLAITEHMANNGLRISPLNEAQLQPASYDVTLAGHFKFVHMDRVEQAEAAQGKTLTMQEIAKRDELWTEWDLEDGEEIEIDRTGFLIASTREVITLPDDVAAQYNGKSSWARIGLATHVTAGFTDPGFTGTVTLEIFSVAPRPVKLTVGAAIGQIMFYRLPTPALKPYGHKDRKSKYSGQQGATLSANPTGAI